MGREDQPHLVGVHLPDDGLQARPPVGELLEGFTGQVKYRKRTPSSPCRRRSASIPLVSAKERSSWVRFASQRVQCRTAVSLRVKVAYLLAARYLRGHKSCQVGGQKEYGGEEMSSPARPDRWSCAVPGSRGGARAR